MTVARLDVASSLIGLSLALLAASASAQQIYRIVGPDGKVTFSDQPPAQANAKLAPVAVPGSRAGGGGGGAALPFELRQVVSKFPVTLYTGNNCGPCGAGRAYLSSRGIPFSERTVITAEDAEALKRLAGDHTIPVLTIGGQQIKGYSDAEWGQFLDAAGYPPRSLLPATYRNPEAAPLVAVQRPIPVAATPTPEPAAQEPTRASVPQERPNNPAGITF